MKKRKLPTVIEDHLTILYRQCCMKLLACQYAYYSGAGEILSDMEYDYFNNRLAAFERENPDRKHPKSPTYSIGAESAEDYPRGAVRWVNSMVDEGKVECDLESWGELFGSLPANDSEWRAEGDA